MTELALFELMSEADCELLARSDVRVNVRRRIGLRVLAVAAAVSVLLIVSLFVGAFAVVRNYKEQHPEIQGGIVEVLGGVLADEESILSEVLPENVKLELGEILVKLGGENPFTPLGPGEEQSTGATETEKETNSNNGVPWHEECDYCGKLDGENRWFIARVVNSNSVKPIGDKCFEAIAAGDAEIDLLNLEKDQFAKMGLSEGDLVCVTYDGYIMESYPAQIRVNSIEPVEP